jgi:hypothetical protein
MAFSHDENKFCLNHPISPTSESGGADGGISFFLTKAILVIIVPLFEKTD